MEPHLSQWAVRLRPHRVDIEPTLPAFYRAFHWPATTVQRHERLG
jgi:hypothetical protein